MTYKQLLDRLLTLNGEQLLQDVTVYTSLDEFFPVIDAGVSGDGDFADGILDHGHLYLEIDG